jgi:hypothetical protein
MLNNKATDWMPFLPQGTACLAALYPALKRHPTSASFLPRDILVFLRESMAGVYFSFPREWVIVRTRRADFRRAARTRARWSPPTGAILRLRPEQSCASARHPEEPSRRPAYPDAGTPFSNLAAGPDQAVLR